MPGRYRGLPARPGHGVQPAHARSVGHGTEPHTGGRSATLSARRAPALPVRLRRGAGTLVDSPPAFHAPRRIAPGRPRQGGRTVSFHAQRHDARAQPAGPAPARTKGTGQMGRRCRKRISSRLPARIPFSRSNVKEVAMTSHRSRFLSRAPSRASQAFVIATALALVAGCSGQSKQRGMPPTPVQVTAVQPQAVPLVREATGRLSAFRSADVRARVGGVLLKRTYDEGTHVDKGQVLFKIDPAPLRATLTAAEASLAQARANYTNAKVQAERARKLAPKGYISKAALDDAEAAERTAAAAVKAAKAQAENARIQLGYATVRAPIAGRAGKQQVTEGALVGQGTATLLTTVRQIDPVYVNFSMPVGELQQLRAKQASGKVTLEGTSKASVTLKLPDGSTYPQAGTMNFSGASVDPSTGAVTLRALIPNPKHVLLPGMYANLEVHMGSLNQAFLVPQNAVQRDTTGAYVLTVGKDDKVVRKSVTLDGMQGPDWVVTQGLSAGDRLIVGGIAQARPGAKVKPMTGQAKPKGQANAKSAAAPAAAATTKPAAAASSKSGGKPSTQS